MRVELLTSFFFHFFLAILAGLFIYMTPSPVSVKKIRFELKEVADSVNDLNKVAPEIKLNKPLAKPKTQNIKKVFGLNKNVMKDAAVGSVAIKVGNTIVTQVDQEKMEEEDANALPIPTEEFLVTRMPRLKSEIRIPYPSDARKNNIEGAVIMDILIDEMGRVRAAKLIQGPGYGLNEAALEAIYRFEFEPAVVEKQAVAVRIRYSYRFELN